MFGRKTTVVIGDRLRTRPAAPRAFEPIRARFPDRPERTPVFHNAIVVIASGERFRVVMKDRSATGARIEFFHEFPIVDRLLLIDAQTGAKRQARVIWRRQGIAGLAFAGA